MLNPNALDDRPPAAQRVLAVAALAGGFGALFLCLPSALSRGNTLGAVFAACLGLGWFAFFAIAARSLWMERTMSPRLTIVLEVFGAVLFGAALLAISSSSGTPAGRAGDLKLWSIVVVLLVDALRRGRTAHT